MARVEQRYLASIALLSCLLLPHHGDVDLASLSDLLWTLFLGGPIPVFSFAACAATAALLCLNGRGAMVGAMVWLTFWLMALAFSWGARSSVFEAQPHWWAWGTSLVVGVWALVVAVRATSRPGQTEVSVFD